MSDTPTPEMDAAELYYDGPTGFVPVEKAREVEKHRNRLRNALRFIAEWGGRTLESEYGDIDCNGRWCAEQAKEAVE